MKPNQEVIDFLQDVYTQDELKHMLDTLPQQTDEYLMGIEFCEQTNKLRCLWGRINSDLAYVMSEDSRWEDMKFKPLFINE